MFKRILCTISIALFLLLNVTFVQAENLLFENLLGDKDNFQFDASQDPKFQDGDGLPDYFDQWYSGDFGRETYIHHFDAELLQGAEIESVILEIRVMDMQDGGGSYDTRLFVDSIEIPKAFDDINGHSQGVTVRFVLDSSLFDKLLDGELIVTLDSTAGTADAYSIDYSLLSVMGVADRDQDGIYDNEDNCPNESNVEQSDRDLDGLGDACDCMPTNPNEPGEDGECPEECASISAISNSTAIPTTSLLAFMLIFSCLLGLRHWE